MATGWSLDFCLVCDRQALGGLYCSQSCRLAELDLMEEVVVIGTPVSIYPQRIHTTATEIAVKYPRVSTVQGHIGYSILPSNNTSTSSQIISSLFSQTSLSSLKSNLSHDPTISGRIQNQLRDYVSCFGQVRNLKR
ncbi:hypothetical protein BDV37DRAFT_291921 [Aspergillus pseudonomiae]|uniref:Uncharacterized protein n=1 Tax=Aspergillus pseudonomiae TaxID=1506151 RepID=A0A5N7CTN9_9EURO|nr:uncharacterized protein BDV37DRAFT_291921 [Aspergillus pseudonomiae]KAE8397571.1 hypothetical protein BDV37DRAFT_291921 [Aspergillus pseudonomiae]